LLDELRAVRKKAAPKQGNDERVAGLDRALGGQLVLLERAGEHGEVSDDSVDALGDVATLEPDRASVGGHVGGVQLAKHVELARFPGAACALDDLDPLA